MCKNHDKKVIRYMFNWSKHKKVYIAEFVAVLVVLLTLFIPLSHYSYSGNDFESESGIFMEGLLDVAEPGYYVDNTVAEAGADKVVVSPATDLRFGSYDVTIKYMASNTGNTYSCESDWNTMPVTLGRTKAGLKRVETADGRMTIKLNSALNVGEYRVEFNFSGDGYLYVYGMEIQETSWWKIYLFLVVLCASFLINGCIALSECENKRVRGDFIVAGILVVFASLPLFDPYLITGHDMGFHLERIEALTANLRFGQFPSRISSDWLGGKGYAASIFYGDLFLLIPAVLRLLGASVQLSYKTYIFLVNVATVGVSMYCFKRFIGSRLGAIIASVVYVLSPYRLLCIYSRAAVGEYTALIFYPLVFLGLMRLYGIGLGTDTHNEVKGSAGKRNGDEKRSSEVNRKSGLREYISRLLPLIIGVTGIINCHVLSGIIVAIFVIGFALINWKKTFTKDVLAGIGIALVAVLLLNLWYIVPFIQVMADGIGVLGLRQNGRFRSNGTYLWQILSLFPRPGISLSSEEIIGEARPMEMVVTIGAGLITLVTYAVMKGYGLIGEMQNADIASNGKDEHDNSNTESGVMNALFVISLLTVFMATPYFPWDGLKRISGVMNSLITNVQFPFRFLSVATLCLALLTGLIIKSISEYKDEINTFVVLNARNIIAIFSIVIVTLSLISASYYMTEKGTSDEFTYIVDEFEEGGIMGAEYLPSGTAEDYDTNYNEPYSETAVINSWKREKGRIYLDVTNGTDDIAEVSVPFIYYRGYRAVDAATKGAIEVVKDDTGFAQLRLGAGYSGSVEVFYKEPVLWRMCEIISLLTIIVLIVGVRLLTEEASFIKR